MPLFHFTAKIISRSTGRSATGAAAYRSGERIVDNRTGLVFDFSRRKAVDRTFSRIVAPEQSHDWVFDRRELWNRAEAAEKRKDAQVTREIELALPVEFSPEEQMDLVFGFVRDQFVSRGMIADVTRHGNAGNPHTHILLTLRPLLDGQFAPKKERAWNDVALLQEWREAWANAQNEALKCRRVTALVDHRSLREQGIIRQPQRHIGAFVWNMAAKGLTWAVEVVNAKRWGWTSEPKVLDEQQRQPAVQRNHSPACRSLDQQSFRNLFLQLNLTQSGPSPRPMAVDGLSNLPAPTMGSRPSCNSEMENGPAGLSHAQVHGLSRGR